MRKVDGMLIPEYASEYDVWRDALQVRHFKVRGTSEDWQLEGWTWMSERAWYEYRFKGTGDGRDGVLIRRFDMFNKKHRYGWCPLDHPLVQALGLRGEHE